MDLFRGLLCDASLGRSGTSPTQLTTRLLGRDPAADGDLFGPPVVDDRRLGELDRMLTGNPVPVTVLNSSGAGGLVSLARRTCPHLAPVAVETLVRDRDDPAGNIARIAVAAAELRPDTAVYVGVPADLDQPAVAEEIEAQGLRDLISTDDGDPAGLADRISACVERDLSFRMRITPPASGNRSDAGPLLAALKALDRLIDDADLADATRLLRGTADTDTAQIREWDQTRVRRVRRRLEGVDLPDPEAIAADLHRCGLVST